jgi:hypothetical protein
MARLGFKIAAFGLVLCAAQNAFAQTAEGSATVSTPPPPPPPTTVSATTSASTSTSAPTPVVASATESADSNTPDHEGVIGHFAVGYMGISQLPIGGFGAAGGGGAAAAFAQNTITAPVIGVRYWLNRMIGIDGGIGFGLASGGTAVNNGNTEVDTDQPSSLGFALHGGVPLAFSHGKHYSFELIPEANVGFTSGTIKAAAANTPDTNLSGFRLDLGARVGTEIYFGFIGIPQLSLQASVGAYFTHQAWKVSQGNTSESITATTLGTSVQGAPWAIFVNNISALYYF